MLCPFCPHTHTPTHHACLGSPLPTQAIATLRGYGPSVTHLSSLWSSLDLHFHPEIKGSTPLLRGYCLCFISTTYYPFPIAYIKILGGCLAAPLSTHGTCRFGTRNKCALGTRHRAPSIDGVCGSTATWRSQGSRARRQCGDSPSRFMQGSTLA